MYAGIDSLSAIIRYRLRFNPYDGSIYVFRDQSGTMLKYTAFVTTNGTVSFSNTQTFARVLGRCLERMGYPSTSKKKSLNNRTENVYYGIQFKG